MLVINAEKIFSKYDLYFCYSPKLKKYLCNIKNISYISKGVNQDSGKSYWLFIRSDELVDCLKEWKENAENGVNAIE